MELGILLNLVITILMATTDFSLNEGYGVLDNSIRAYFLFDPQTKTFDWGEIYGSNLSFMMILKPSPQQIDVVLVRSILPQFIVS